MTPGEFADIILDKVVGRGYSRSEGCSIVITSTYIELRHTPQNTNPRIAAYRWSRQVCDRVEESVVPQVVETGVRAVLGR